MNNSDIKKAITNVSAYLVTRLAEEKHTSRDQALEQVMKTAVYSSLLDPETGLYCEPKDAVYNILDEELNNHPEEIMKI